MQDLSSIRAVLLDIEGTICPISWVKDTLFPYAIEALPQVLAEKWNDPEFQPYKNAFPPEARSDPQALEAHVKDLTKRDVKIAYLKNLQGYLWQAGFESRAYSAPLFEDVLPAMQRWHDKGLSCSIYSSGSVFAQKLLFAHIKDMSSSDDKAILNRTDLISFWFDTVNAGPKTSKDSYTKIASELQHDPQHILFLSDNPKEVIAAQQAGLAALIVDRPGNAELSDQDKGVSEIVTNFDDLPR